MGQCERMSPEARAWLLNRSEWCAYSVPPLRSESNAFACWARDTYRTALRRHSECGVDSFPDIGRAVEPVRAVRRSQADVASRKEAWPVFGHRLYARGRDWIPVRLGKPPL